RRRELGERRVPLPDLVQVDARVGEVHDDVDVGRLARSLRGDASGQLTAGGAGADRVAQHLPRRLRVADEPHPFLLRRRAPSQLHQHVSRGPGDPPASLPIGCAVAPRTTPVRVTESEPMPATFTFGAGNARKLLRLPLYALGALAALLVPRTAKLWAFGCGIGLGEGALPLYRVARE